MFKLLVKESDVYLDGLINELGVDVVKTPARAKAIYDWALKYYGSEKNQADADAILAAHNGADSMVQSERNTKLQKIRDNREIIWDNAFKILVHDKVAETGVTAKEVEIYQKALRELTDEYRAGPSGADFFAGTSGLDVISEDLSNFDWPHKGYVIQDLTLHPIRSVRDASILYVDPSGVYATTTVGVSGNDITVTLKHDGGAITADANDVKAKLESSVSGIMTVYLTGSGSSLQAAQDKTDLYE